MEGYWEDDLGLLSEEGYGEVNEEVNREYNLEFAERIGRGKEVLKLQATFDNLVGFIRYPKEIVESLPERRITNGNYDEAVIKTAIALLENPDKWITEV